MSPYKACQICGKKGPLDDVLYYCEKCKQYFCVDCLTMYDGNDAYASHSKKLFYCPKEHHYMGSDWF